MPPCQSLTEIRDNIDRLDRQIVALLCERQGYVGQAAAFKPTRSDVVVPERIEEIVGKVRALAAERGGSADLMERIYRAMIDAYIAFEDRRWGELHDKASHP
ncbi:salicylate biosynthesis protein PchB [mine drainage metagenome]|uniref:Salicylate biosynthesis protein PchB n=1 Tax=mine drainage metagenome TaxID=410659 RepID=A0A1J5T1T0_9ZZZZ